MTEGKFPKSPGDHIYSSETNGLISKAFADVKFFKIDATTASSSVDLSSVDYKYTISIKNSGFIDCYIDLDDTATTDGFFLPYDSEIILENVDFDNISAITSTGTTTLNIAVYIGAHNKTGFNTHKEILKIAVTEDSGSVSFTDTTNYKDIIIINEGVNNAYISFTDTATTNDFILKEHQTLFVLSNPAHISAICVAGQTTTLKILGVW